VTYSVEFIVNTGQFEHAKITLTFETWTELNYQLKSIEDELPITIGNVAAALNGAVKHGYKNPAEARESFMPANQEAEKIVAAEELIVSELGGKIIKTTDNEALRELAEVLGVPEAKPNLLAEVFTDKPEKPWERPVKAAASKPWESGTPVVQRPAQSGLEDF
jgi:hypothetical protein